MYLSQDNLKTQLKAPMSGNLCRCRLQQRLQGLQVKQLSPCFCYFPLSCYCNLQIKFLDAIVSPSSYPCQSVDQWVSQWFIVSDLEIATYISHLRALRACLFTSTLLRQWLLKLSKSMRILSLFSERPHRHITPAQPAWLWESWRTK